MSGFIGGGSGGGTASPLTTKGDIYTYDTGNARLPVGGDGGLLTADSTQATGIGWATLSTSDADLFDVTNVSGSITLGIDAKFENTGMHGWNGSLLESAAVTVTSDGATITCSVELSGGGDLTAVFSDGYYDWDTTPPDAVTLTEGSDTSPQINYVYFLQSTKALTAATGGFPAAEHAPIATVLCQSAASLQTDGPYKMHAWTDHVTASTDQGHVADLNSWIRQQSATWINGVSQTYTITTNAGAADNVILTTTSGNVLQLHPQTFPAFAGTPDVYVVNDSGTPYTKITDLNALLTDSTGASMAGRYFSLVIWGCVSEDTGDCKLFCNLPGGSYVSSAGVTADSNKYANFDIPGDFTGTGFLISRWDLRHQAAASGTWTSINETDLRGLVPAISPGGSNAFPTEFEDNTFRIVDEGDNSKEIAFQASGITPATTRTLTVPDADGTIALTSDIPEVVVGGLASAHSVNTTTAFPPTNYRDFGSLEMIVRNFDDTGPEYMQGFFRVPEDLGAGSSNVTFEIVGSAVTAVASKNVKFTFDFIEVADDGLLTGAYGSAEVWDDQSISGTQDDQDIISNTETITNLGWTAGNSIYYRLYRSAATTNNLSGDYSVIAFNIRIPQA